MRAVAIAHYRRKPNRPASVGSRAAQRATTTDRHLHGQVVGPGCGATVEPLRRLVPGAQRQKESKEMDSDQLAKGDINERYKQLAGEVAARAILDIHLLNRRKILKGLKVVGQPRHRLSDCLCYRKVPAIKRLVKDFKDGTILSWCRLAGAKVDQATLNRYVLGRYRR